MKSQVSASKLPVIEVIKADESYDFLKGKNLFADKHARAKVAFSKMKFPEGYGLK